MSVNRNEDIFEKHFKRKLPFLPCYTVMQQQKALLQNLRFYSFEDPVPRVTVNREQDEYARNKEHTRMITLLSRIAVAKY